VSIKLVPGLFFVPLLLRRQWSVLSQCGAWIVALNVVLPMFFLGTGVLPAYATWARSVLSFERYFDQYPPDVSQHFYSVYGAIVWLVPAWKGSLWVRVAGTLAVLVPLGAMETHADVLSSWRRFAR